MAKNHRNKPRQLTPRESLAQGSRQLHVPAERFSASMSISNDINQKVRGVVSGLLGVKSLYIDIAEKEEYAEFFNQNKTAIEALLKYDLPSTYQKLVDIHHQRQQIYHELEAKGVISKTELGHLLGTVSPQPYNAYIRSLGARVAPANDNNSHPPVVPGNDNNSTPNAALTPPQTPLSTNDLERLSGATDPNNLEQLVNELKSEHKLSDAEAGKLIELGPKSDEQIKKARENILIKIEQHNLLNNPSYKNQYETSLQKEEEILTEIDAFTDEYNRLSEGLVSQIQEMYQSDQNEKVRQDRVDMLSKEVGFEVEPGQILYGKNSNKSPARQSVAQPKNNRIEITAISYGEEESDPEILPDFKKNIPTLEPVIEFTVTNEDGKVLDYKLSAPNFRKWALSHEVGQKFEDLTELEKKLGLSDTLKAGQSFEYIETVIGATDEEHAFQIKSVQIEKIEGDQIFLDQEVILDQHPSDSGFRITKRAKQLDFSNFARWYKKANAVPEINSLQQLDTLLDTHHQDLLKEMGWEQDHGESIKLTGLTTPLVLISAYDPEDPNAAVVVESAKDGEIHIEGGAIIKPHQFYRLIREEGLTRPTAGQLAEIKKMAEGKKDTQAIKKIAELEGKSPVAKESKSKAEQSPTSKPVGYWKSLWADTTFLNLMEVYELFIKAPKTRVEEWMKNRSERRIYKVGKNFYKGFPAFGGLDDLTESYDDKLNSKNSGDVKDLMEWYDKNLYTEDVMDKLHEVKDIDSLAAAKTQFKAAIQLVMKKGIIRWEDDKDLMAAVNQLNTLSGGKYKYAKKFHHIVDPNLAVKVNDPGPLSNPLISVFDQYRSILDGVYGDGTFDSWNQQNDSSYNSQKEDAAKNMHKFEFMQGGIGRQLQKMLADWEEGLPVNQAEFDGLLTGAISGMEVNMEQGMLLFISAFSVKNKDGKTLLTFSRLNPYIKALGDHLVYVFFAVGHKLVDEEGNPLMIPDEKGGMKVKEGKFSINNFQQIYRDVIQKDMNTSGKGGFERFTAGKNTINWIQSEILLHKKVKERASNKAGNSNTDVGLYHYIGPLMWKENDLDKVIGGSYGSLQKTEILQNMYAGYNNQLIIRANRVNQGKTAEENDLRAAEFGQMIYSFIYFNNILMNRIRTGQNYMRITGAMLQENPAVDKTRRVAEFASETEQFTIEFGKGVAQLSRDPELRNLTNQVLLNRGGHLNDDLESKYRDKLYTTIRELAKTHPKELASLAREKAQLMKGMSGAQLTWEEREKQKAA